MSGIRLVVQADDLGMCRAVNDGIIAAADDGVLTQASVMAPTPWFVEGAAAVRRVGLPVGLHATLTCEWDVLRWGPLTPARTLRDTDGLFPTTVEAVAAAADPAEASAELVAQAERARRCGLQPRYVDPHMGVSVPSAWTAAARHLGVRYLYPDLGVPSLPLLDPHHELDSVMMLSIMSAHDAASRTAWLVGWLDALGVGLHLLVTHPAVDDAEMAAVCSDEAPNRDWSVPVRAADLAALTAPEVRRVVERRAIELVAIEP